MLGDRRYCYPLTVTDHASRYLLLCEAMESNAEIAAMWRFSRNNGIAEGFHTKMEILQRQAYGFRNFQNYRLRVRVMCS